VRPASRLVRLGALCSRAVPTESDVLTVEEAAKRLGIGRNTAYEAVRRGEIPSIRVGRRLLVPRRALDKLLSGEGKNAA
jgi:excisionase family DNA binding protein